jgi:acyl carrier protein
MTIEEKIIQLASDELGSPIEASSSLEDVDSLEFVDLLLVVQNTFGIVIPDEQFSSIKSVADLVKLVTEAKDWEARVEGHVSG